MKRKNWAASSSSFLCEVIDVVVQCGSIPLQNLLSRQTQLERYIRTSSQGRTVAWAKWAIAPPVFVGVSHFVR